MSGLTITFLLGVACATLLAAALLRYQCSTRLVSLALGAILVAHMGVYWRFTVDDAFIAFRFARNWAAGLGLVFQRGQNVEGFTSFLWVALLAGARRLGLAIEPTAKVLGLGFSIVILYAVSWLARRVTRERASWIVAPLFLALSSVFVAWVGAGLETMMFAAAVSGAAALLEREDERPRGFPLSALVLGVSVLVRPEGVLFAAVGLVCVLVRESHRGEIKRAASWLGWFAVIAGPYWFWRWAHFGAFFPNTFYAKVGTDPHWLGGVRSLAEFMDSQGLLVLMLAVVGVVAGAWRTTAWRFCWLGGAAFGAYLVWVGGDVLHLRFFVYIMGLLGVCVAAGFDAVAVGLTSEGSMRSRLGQGQLVRLEFAALVVWIGWSLLGDVRTLKAKDQMGAAYVVNNARNVTSANAPLGLWLEAHAHPGSKVAAWDVGAVGFFSHLDVIDLYGLTDRAMARLVWRGASDAVRAAYVKEKDPEYIVTPSPAGVADERFLKAQEAWFRDRYRADSLWHGGPDGYEVTLFVRKDVAGPQAVHRDGR